MSGSSLRNGEGGEDNGKTCDCHMVLLLAERREILCGVEVMLLQTVASGAVRSAPPHYFPNWVCGVGSKSLIHVCHSILGSIWL